MSEWAAVCFDLDGTLVSERVGVREARLSVGEALRERGLSAAAPEAFVTAVEAVVSETLAAHEGRWPAWFHVEEWLTAALRRVGVEETLIGDAEALGSLADIYKGERIARAAAIPGASEAVEAARRRGPVALITNFGEGELQRRKIAAAGLEGRFDLVAISGEVGCWKPEPCIFHHTAEGLGVNPRDCVHIGNSVESDVEGALGAGMSALLVEESDRARPDDLDARAHWCADLTEVVAWLEG